PFVAWKFRGQLGGADNIGKQQPASDVLNVDESSGMRCSDWRASRRLSKRKLRLSEIQNITLGETSRQSHASAVQKCAIAAAKIDEPILIHVLPVNKGVAPRNQFVIDYNGVTG